ncbi:MAG: glycogen/starch synthase, partial [Ilumatobacter sp.]
MRVLFATAELRPLASAGGLGEAAAGLAAALTEAGVDVITVIPGYSHYELDDEQQIPLDVPPFAAPASARLGDHAVAGRLAVIDVPGIVRPEPYVDGRGQGWPDNDRRFASFAAAVASLARTLAVDLVQLNDWHTALVPAFLGEGMPTVLTIHNLAHQGWCAPGWIHELPSRRQAYVHRDAVNSLAGAIRLADRVVTVSPNYAREITTAREGFGLEHDLAARGRDLRGILTGIDARAWDPSTDAHAPHFSVTDMAGKQAARAALLDRAGWAATDDPLMVMVTRLVEQKGVDLAFEAARFLAGMKARLLVLGSGEPRLAEWGHWLGNTQPDRVWFYNGYDAPLSHELFAGGDLLLMPSRFEPCGLAQMQAMAYGTLPIVTPVGGLVDTVVDADLHPNGTGFVAASVDESGIVDVVHRALRGVRHADRRKAMQKRGMTTDWSWGEPAAEFVAL